MMMIHPDYALRLAKDLLHERVAEAEAFRHARRTAAAPADCLIPVAPPATTRCRPDPRRGAAGPAGWHRSRHATAHQS